MRRQLLPTCLFNPPCPHPTPTARRDGYGGAVVYTRARQLPPGLIPQLTKAADSAGLDFRQFQLTDNSCRAHPPRRGLVDEVEGEIEDSLRSFGRGFTVLVDPVAREVGGWGVG